MDPSETYLFLRCSQGISKLRQEFVELGPEAAAAAEDLEKESGPAVQLEYGVHPKKASSAPLQVSWGGGVEM